MSKFARGIKRGIHVKQGQVIGYVGSTGMATGPHVCYRFWVNGKQVDPQKVDLPPSQPVPYDYMFRFGILEDSLKMVLDSSRINIKNPETHTGIPQLIYPETNQSAVIP
jgi:murein DD-endopeptidase MepM/ murein hydrolase activator NlpD